MSKPSEPIPKRSRKYLSQLEKLQSRAEDQKKGFWRGAGLAILEGSLFIYLMEEVSQATRKKRRDRQSTGNGVRSKILKRIGIKDEHYRDETHIGSRKHNPDPGDSLSTEAENVSCNAVSSIPTFQSCNYGPSSPTEAAGAALEPSVLLNTPDITAEAHEQYRGIRSFIWNGNYERLDDDEKLSIPLWWSVGGTGLPPTGHELRLWKQNIRSHRTRKRYAKRLQKARLIVQPTKVLMATEAEVEHPSQPQSLSVSPISLSLANDVQDTLDNNCEIAPSMSSDGNVSGHDEPPQANQSNSWYHSDHHHQDRSYVARSGNMVPPNLAIGASKATEAGKNIFILLFLTTKVSVMIFALILMLLLTVFTNTRLWSLPGLFDQEDDVLDMAPDLSTNKASPIDSADEDHSDSDSSTVKGPTIGDVGNRDRLPIDLSLDMNNNDDLYEPYRASSTRSAPETRQYVDSWAPMPIAPDNLPHVATSCPSRVCIPSGGVNRKDAHIQDSFELPGDEPIVGQRSGSYIGENASDNRSEPEHASKQEEGTPAQPKSLRPQLSSLERKWESAVHKNEVTLNTKKLEKEIAAAQEHIAASRAGINGPDSRDRERLEVSPDSSLTEQRQRKRFGFVATQPVVDLDHLRTSTSAIKRNSSSVQQTQNYTGRARLSLQKGLGIHGIGLENNMAIPKTELPPPERGNHWKSGSEKQKVMPSPRSPPPSRFYRHPLKMNPVPDNSQSSRSAPRLRRRRGMGSLSDTSYVTEVEAPPFPEERKGKEPATSELNPPNIAGNENIATSCSCGIWDCDMQSGSTGSKSQ